MQLMTKSWLLQRTPRAWELVMIRWLEPSVPHIGLTSREEKELQPGFMPHGQRHNKHALIRKPTRQPRRAGFRELGVLSEQKCWHILCGSSPAPGLHVSSMSRSGRSGRNWQSTKSPSQHPVRHSQPMSKLEEGLVGIFSTGQKPR